MEIKIYELTIEEQKTIYGGEEVIVGYEILEDGSCVPVYCSI